MPAHPGRECRCPTRARLPLRNACQADGIPARARVGTLVDGDYLYRDGSCRAPGDGPGVTGLIGSRGAGGRSGSGRRRDKPGQRADRPPSGRGRPHQGLEGRRTDTNASPRQIPQATCKTPRSTATMGRQWTPCPTRSAENSRQFPKTGNVAEHNQPLHKTTIDKKARLAATITRFRKPPTNLRPHRPPA